MESSKIKNIVLIILALTNVALLGMVLHQNYREQSARMETRAAALLYLERAGIAVEANQIPEETELQPMRTRRDRADERRLASALLGEPVEREERGGGVVRFCSEMGCLQFHADGAFQGEFSPGAFPIQENTMTGHAVQVLSLLGITARTITPGPQGGDGTVIMEQMWEGVPVFGMQTEVNYRDGCLVSITGGRRLPGQPEPVRRPVLSVPSALVYFSTGLSALGDVCSRIHEIVPGYVALPALTGEMTLTPVWMVSTDTGTYLLDTTTGELTRDPLR